MTMITRWTLNKWKQALQTYVVDTTDVDKSDPRKVFDVGKKHDPVLLITEGEVELWRGFYRLAVLGPGQWLGLDQVVRSIVEGSPPRSKVLAWRRTPTLKAIPVKLEEFVILCKTKPKFARQVGLALADLADAFADDEGQYSEAHLQHMADCPPGLLPGPYKMKIAANLFYMRMTADLKSRLNSRLPFNSSVASELATLVLARFTDVGHANAKIKGDGKVVWDEVGLVAEVVHAHGLPSLDWDLPDWRSFDLRDVEFRPCQHLSWLHPDNALAVALGRELCGFPKVAGNTILEKWTQGVTVKRRAVTRLEPPSDPERPFFCDVTFSGGLDLGALLPEWLGDIEELMEAFRRADEEGRDLGARLPASLGDIEIDEELREALGREYERVLDLTQKVDSKRPLFDPHLWIHPRSIEKPSDWRDVIVNFPTFPALPTMWRRIFDVETAYPLHASGRPQETQESWDEAHFDIDELVEVQFDITPPLRLPTLLTLDESPKPVLPRGLSPTALPGVRSTARVVQRPGQVVFDYLGDHKPGTPAEKLRMGWGFLDD